MPTFRYLYGNNADNTIFGSASPNVIDVIDGYDADDMLYGRGGNDILIGNTGRDSLYGEDGNDTLHLRPEGGVTGEVADGGSGSDTVQIINYPFYGVSGAGAVIDLVAGSWTTDGTIKRAQLISIENLNYSDLASSGDFSVTGSLTVIGSDADNTLMLRAAATTVAAGKGNDTIGVTSGAHVVDGGEGSDTLALWWLGNAKADDTRGYIVSLALAGAAQVQKAVGGSLTLTGIENLDGSAGDDRLTGDGGDNVLSGGLGNDLLTGGAGNDRLFGDDRVADAPRYTFDGATAPARLVPALDDTLEGGTGDDNLDGGEGFDQASYRNAAGAVVVDLGTGKATGADGNDTLTRIDGVLGSNFADTLSGDDGANWLDGGGGVDTMAGGKGNDTYVINVAGDVIIEKPGEGSDTIVTPFSWTVGGGIENITLSGSKALDAIGDGRANVLTGNAGINRLTGGLGDDTYEVQNAGDVVIEDDAAGGRDTVRSVIDWTLGANFEDLVLIGSSAIGGTGNALSNTITGNAASNRLDGGAGQDTLIGGDGDDIYVVDNLEDTLVEGPRYKDGAYNKAGIDTVLASVSFTLAADIENLTLTGTDAINGTGSTEYNTITGNDADNVLTAVDGNDTLIGAGGNDTLIADGYGNTLRGGAGDDTYVLNGVAFIDEAVGGGVDIIVGSGHLTLGANIENGTGLKGKPCTITGNELDNTLTASDDFSTLFGGGGNDTLLGGISDDVLAGGEGADIMTGGTGDDIYSVTEIGDQISERAQEGTDWVNTFIDYTLDTNLENLAVYGAHRGTGNALANFMTGDQADNTLDGAGGADRMSGGRGNDVYFVDLLADKVIEIAGEGYDTVVSSIDFSLARTKNVEALTLTGAAIRGEGNALANLIKGNDLANVLVGGAGDTLIGGKGDDSYIVSGTNVLAYEDFGDGTDSVSSSATIALGSNIENLILTGRLAIDGTGNDVANTITGNASANTLIGGAGADTLIGGAGNDTYGVDEADDKVIEIGGGGQDTVRASTDYTLADQLENLQITGNHNGTGNAGNNVMSFVDGDGILYGLGGADTLTGGWGNDTLVGGDGIDTLNGGFGDDTLDGGAGADRMIGGGGFDVFIVDNAKDTITGAGRVEASISWTLSTDTQELRLTGAAKDGTGNGSDNVIEGNALANKLAGLDGNDRLDGGGGIDALTGGAGNDTLSGGTGSDTVDGGEGDDTLDGEEGDDTLTGGTGNDTLSGGTGSDTVDGGEGVDTLDGEEGDDTLTGGAGNDRLIGGTGNDTMNGGAGDDIYVVDSTGDKVSETGGSGRDAVVAQASAVLGEGIEGGIVDPASIASLTGNASANVLFGNNFTQTLDGKDGDDMLFGFGGADTLIGGAGNDLLIGAVARATGGSGLDTFVVGTDGNTASTITVTDFVSGTDRLLVINPFVSGLLLAGGFVQGTSAKDEDDIAIYDKSTGRLYADIDGNGAGAKVLIATLAPGTNLAASDIQLIDEGSFNSQVGEALNWLNGVLFSL